MIPEFSQCPAKSSSYCYDLWNIVFHYGIERFGKDYRRAGFQGLIVADFPLETSGCLII